jgi:hypothetical protein
MSCHSLLDVRGLELVFVRQPGESHGVQLSGGETLTGLPLLEDPVDALGHKHHSMLVSRVRSGRSA